jgi:hypothetical protein
MREEPVELAVKCDFCEMASNIVAAGLSLGEPVKCSRCGAELGTVADLLSGMARQRSESDSGKSRK